MAMQTWVRATSQAIRIRAATNFRLFVPIRRVVGLALIAAAIPGCWKGATREVSATVLFVEGRPTINPSTSGTSVLLTEDAHPSRGDLIETPASSRAALCVLPNLLVQVEPESRLKIGRLAVVKNGNETGSAMLGRYADARALKGRMFVSFVWGEALARLTVSTPHGELVANSNALFCLDVDSSRTRITCASGLLNFRPRDASNPLRISSGSMGESAGATLNIVPAETDARAQDDVVEALQIESKLRETASRKRNLLPR